jgi:hypothetical protein
MMEPIQEKRGNHNQDARGKATGMASRNGKCTNNEKEDL